MSLHETLRRLEEAVSDPPPENQRGIGPGFRKVWVEDLREILYHFHRLDAQVRDQAERPRTSEVDNLIAMEYYRRKVTSSVEEANKALQAAGILDENGEIAAQYKSLFRSDSDEQTQVPPHPPSFDEPERER